MAGGEQSYAHASFVLSAFGEQRSRHDVAVFPSYYQPTGRSVEVRTLHCKDVKSCFFNQIFWRPPHPPTGRSRSVAEALERKRPSVGAGPARAGWRKRRPRATLSRGRGQSIYNFGCGRKATLRSDIVRDGAHTFYEWLGYEIFKTQDAYRKRLAP